MSSDNENFASAMAVDEINKLDPAVESEWLYFDALAEIRDIVSSEDCGGSYDLPCWYPRINFAFSDTTNNREKPIPLDQNTIPKIAPLDTYYQLVQRLKKLSIRFSESQEMMKSLLTDISDYASLPEVEREQYDIADLIERSSLIKREYNKLQYDCSILSYDFQSASDVTVEKEYVRESVNRLFKMVFDVGVVFEKCMFSVILLKAHRKNFDAEKKVSESLSRLEIEVETMRGWNSPSPSVDDNSRNIDLDSE